MIERSLGQAEFGHWKVVGWIESLNDLLYFVDILRQVRQERSRRDIAEQLRAEFKEKFYEHGYADEIFPDGTPEPGRLLSRLTGLCRRLAREVTQESLCLAPRLACRWVAMQPGKKVWLVPCDLSADVERVELPGVCVIGTTGLGYEAPRLARQALTRAGGQAKFMVKASGIDLLVGEQSYVMVEFGEVERWHWRRIDSYRLKDTGTRASPLGRRWYTEKKRPRWRYGRRGQKWRAACGARWK